MTTTSKNKLFIFTIAILLLANIAMLVFFVWIKEPKQKEYRHERSKNPVSELLQNKIGFNEQQMRQYEQMKQQHREKMKPLFEEIRNAKEQFYAHLNEATVSDSVLNTMAENIGEKQEIFDRQIFNHFRNLRELCSAEQKPHFDSLIQKVVGKMIGPPRRHRPDSTNTEKKADNKK